MRTKHTEQYTMGLQTLSTLIRRTRALMSAQLGMQYDGARNLYTALGYPEELTFQHYLGKYQRLDVAKAIIDRPVNATWRGILELEESGKAEVTPFESAWKKLRNDLNLKLNFSRLDKLANLGRYAVLFLGFSDGTSTEKFAMSVKQGAKLKYVRPFSEESARIQAYEGNRNNPRYGKPLFYEIKFANEQESNGTTQMEMSTVQVHHSRILHVIEDQLESEVFGTPKLQAVYNRLMDLEKIVGGDGEMFWRGARPGYAGKTDENFGSGSQGEEALAKQIDEFEHDLRRILIAEGVELKELAQQIADPKNHVEIQLQMICAVTGIPKRILTGSERGELSSEQDSEEYRSFVQERREEKAESIIVRPFVELMLKYGVLPQPVTGEYMLAWPNSYDLNPKQKSEVGKNRADALRLYTTNPIAQIILPHESFMELGLGLTDAEIELAVKRRQKPFGDEEGQFAKSMKFLEKITTSEPVEAPTKSPDGGKGAAKQPAKTPKKNGN